MSLWRKTYLWALLPVVVILGLLECFWVEIYRIATDSLFIKTFKENYRDVKQLYTVDIWE